MPIRSSRLMAAAFTLAVGIAAACEPEAAPVDPADQPAQPGISCVGVPPGICQQMLDDARRNAQPGTFVVQLHIRCTKPPCTLASGEADSTVVYSDGSTTGMGMGWEGAAPAPAAAPAVPAPAVPVPEPTLAP